MSEFDINEGDVFVKKIEDWSKKQKFRRVVGIFKDYVFYSKGGDKVHYKKISKFKKRCERKIYDSKSKSN